MSQMSRRLAAYRAAAAALIAWERAIAAFWPVLAAAAAMAGIALTGLPSELPVWLRLTVALVALGALGVLAWRAVSDFRLPARAEAERRLERESGLRHRPFATLRDAPEGADAAQAALWRAHQARALAAIARLRLGAPEAVLPARDPRALRAAACLLLAAGLVIAGPQAGPRLTAFLLPGLDSLSAPSGPVIQAWIQPPPYTGLPPVFLPAGGGAVSVPTGSRLSVSVTGVSAAPVISIAGVRQATTVLGQASFQAVATLAKPGELRIAQGSFAGFFARLFTSPPTWTLALIANDPPLASWPKAPGRAGTSLSTALPWRVSHAWGVAGLEAELRPMGRPDLPALRLPIPLPGQPKAAEGSATQDLAANPYAGVPMTGWLDARDVSGQHGRSPPADFVLPARVFHHPLARAVAELRRRLALHPDQLAEQAAELRALTEVPPAPAVPGLAASSIILNLATAAARLDSKPDAAEVASVQKQLWTLALALDGALPDAATAALDEARENLRRGLEDRMDGKLSKHALDEKLKALREALDKKLQEMARQAIKQGALPKFDPKSQHLSNRAIDRALKRLERALEEGRARDAREAMAELNRMMDQLKDAHIMTPEETRRAEEQQKENRQKTGAVDDMVQRETKLLDHAEARAAQPLPGAPTDPAPPVAPQTAPSAPQDARTQRALRRALDALRQAAGPAPHGQTAPGHGEAAPPAPSPAEPSPPAPAPSGSARALAEAGQAMDDASGALARQDDPTARDAIARAIAALQKGGQAMAREQRQGQGGGGMVLSLQQGGPGADGADQAGDEGEDGDGEGGGHTHRDPFGRHVEGNGTASDDSDLKIPTGREEGQSRAIQDELRRRGADRARPKGELDYIDRLLKPF